MKSFLALSTLSLVSASEARCLQASSQTAVSTQASTVAPERSAVPLVGVVDSTSSPLAQAIKTSSGESIVTEVGGEVVFGAGRLFVRNLPADNKINPLILKTSQGKLLTLSKGPTVASGIRSRTILRLDTKTNKISVLEKGVEIEVPAGMVVLDESGSPLRLPGLGDRDVILDRGNLLVVPLLGRGGSNSIFGRMGLLQQGIQLSADGRSFVLTSTESANPRQVEVVRRRLNASHGHGHGSRHHGGGNYGHYPYSSKQSYIRPMGGKNEYAGAINFGFSPNLSSRFIRPSTLGSSTVLQSPAIAPVWSTTSPSFDVLMPPSSDILMPSTSNILLPSTSDILMPSTSDILMPSTSDILMPSTSDILMPSTSDILMPSTSEWLSTDTTPLIGSSWIGDTVPAAVVPYDLPLESQVGQWSDSNLLPSSLAEPVSTYTEPLIVETAAPLTETWVPQQPAQEIWPSTTTPEYPPSTTTGYIPESGIQQPITYPTTTTPVSTTTPPIIPVTTTVPTETVAPVTTTTGGTPSLGAPLSSVGLLQLPNWKSSYPPIPVGLTRQAAEKWNLQEQEAVKTALDNLKKEKSEIDNWVTKNPKFKPLEKEIRDARKARLSVAEKEAEVALWDNKSKLPSLQAADKVKEKNNALKNLTAAEKDLNKAKDMAKYTEKKFNDLQLKLQKDKLYEDPSMGPYRTFVQKEADLEKAHSDATLRLKAAGRAINELFPRIRRIAIESRDKYGQGLNPKIATEKWDAVNYATELARQDSPTGSVATPTTAAPVTPVAASPPVTSAVASPATLNRL